tara:strand:- start:906 stop:1277 length:372 start_codon:yes stop_codon:yes gene_type:complete
MMQIIISAIVMLSLDILYLNLFKGYFNKVVNNIQGSPIELDYYATIGCYMAMVFGINYFILRENRGYVDAFFLGLLIYSVFDLTTKAIFKKWEYKAVVIDSLWGGILFAITTILTKKIYRIII